MLAKHKGPQYRFLFDVGIDWHRACGCVSQQRFLESIPTSKKNLYWEPLCFASINAEQNNYIHACTHTCTHTHTHTHNNSNNRPRHLTLNIKSIHYCNHIDPLMILLTIQHLRQVVKRGQTKFKH